MTGRWATCGVLVAAVVAVVGAGVGLCRRWVGDGGDAVLLACEGTMGDGGGVALEPIALVSAASGVPDVEHPVPAMSTARVTAATIVLR